MIVELTNTNATEIHKALLRAHRNQGVATGQVFTLIIICDSGDTQRALEAATLAGKEHPSRVILLSRGAGKRHRCDAEIRAQEEMPGDLIILRLAGDVAQHSESLILPLLLPDLPSIAWWPYDSPDDPTDDPVGALATRRITDAAGAADPVEALRVRAVTHVPGDTDLAWTRLTPWRAMLAAAVDQFEATYTGAVIEADADNAPAVLLQAWLSNRLGVDASLETNQGPGITRTAIQTPAGEIEITRDDGAKATYRVPGRAPRIVALRRRGLNELLTEELRRLDDDEIFDAAMARLARGTS